MQESSHLKGLGAKQKPTLVGRSRCGFCVAKNGGPSQKSTFRKERWNIDILIGEVSMISLDAFSVCCMMFLGKAAR